MKITFLIFLVVTLCTPCFGKSTKEKRDVEEVNDEPRDPPDPIFDENDEDNTTDVASAAIFRLVGRNNNVSGRVEVFHDGVWGTVCDDSFGQTDADMICRSMGFPGAETFACCSANGRGTGQIWLDDLNCAADATSLSGCTGWSWGQHNCGHNEDVSVRCIEFFRLVGGSSHMGGRVEVFHDGVWGTVCDDSFGQTEADMICRSIGYPAAQNYSCCAAYGQGSGQIWLDDLNCPVNATNPHECSGWSWGRHNCRHTDDVSVTCAQSFRLVGGTSSSNGRVEILNNGVWGTVCDDNFGQTEADMICRSMGYSSAQSYSCCADYGQGSGPIWLDNLNCPSGVSSLNQCTGWSWGVHNCGHLEDAGVQCYTDSEDAFRLVGGTSEMSGRVEVFLDGVWGTVCDDGFGQTEADMICRAMGSLGALSYACCAANGRGSGQIWLDDLNCDVNATTLDGCTGWSWGQHNCDHGDDVSVTCRTRFRLVDGNGPSDGRVEVFHNTWGTVCDDGFGQTEADMICRSMGYSGAESFACCAANGRGTGPIWLDDLNCAADATSLSNCTGWSWGRHNCGHHEDVRVHCSGFIRLVGSNNHMSGRVEVFHNGIWGTVCVESFRETDADMICRTMGYPAAQNYSAAYGQGSGEVWLEDLNCPLNATILEECSGWSWGRRHCSHMEVVIVACTSSFRLVGGSGPSNGRVEVFHNNVWGTVCDDIFGPTDADMICRSVGYLGAESFLCCAANGHGTGPIWLDDLNCAADATSLSSCTGWSWGRHNCGHQEDVSVYCSGFIHLVGGNNQMSGVVEVFHNGIWGTICVESFRQTDADMICRTMGYQAAQNYSTAYDQGSGEIWLDDLNCPANVTNLDECSGWSWGRRHCSHMEVVSVACTSSFRLAGGSGPLNGRVEVFYNNLWGTVCDDGFGQTDADMICRSMGYSGADSFACCDVNSLGTGPIWLDELNCAADATSLNDCTGWSWGRHYCNHYDDVSVRCSGFFRLVGGSSQMGGRVEVFHDGVWGKVCVESFRQTDADMICRTMGYPAVKNYSTAYGQGSGEVWLDDLNCPANATNLDECSGWSWGRRHCSHMEVVSVECTPSFRLVGGSGPSDGRVEVFHDDIWGTVCDDAFEQTEADMVCRSMGFRGAESFACCAANGEGTGEIWLDNLNCAADATSLSDCTRWSWGQHNCGHHEDVSVHCIEFFRLVGGNNHMGGRVEVFHDGVWGTVCDDSFGQTEADMICRTMGFRGAVSYECCAANGRGSGQIWLDDLNCAVNATTLDGCAGWSWGQHNCDHGDDVSVTCRTPFRLVGGSGPAEGRVEVFHDNTWGTVCDDAFGRTDADMICRSMGFSGARSYSCCAAYGQGSGQIWLDDLNCPSGVSSLDRCTGWLWGSHNCAHSEDAGVACITDGVAFRLVGGSGPAEGRVEAFHDNTWGTVCDDAFGRTDADMICRSMGFSGARSYSCCAAYGQGSGQIWLDNLNCPSGVSSLDRCTGWSWGVHNCAHSEDAGVACITDGVVVAFRLVGGSGPAEGRVEVFHDNTWGTVCDDAFGRTDADMICRSMGFSGARSYSCCAAYGQGSGQIWLDDLNCPSGVSSLDRCTGWSWGVHNCAHSEDAGVACITDGVELITFAQEEATTWAPEELGPTAESPSSGCGNMTIFDASGTIRSPNYPNNYPNNANCQWAICTNQSQVIQITVEVLQLESHRTCSYDVLHFSNSGAFTDGDMKCGRMDVGYSVFVSTGNCVYVRFTSDSSIIGSGFQISYQALTRSRLPMLRQHSNKVKGTEP